MGDELREKAWMVWKAVRRDIDGGVLKPIGQQAFTDGGHGLLVQTSLRKYVRTLWPSIHAVDLETFSAPIYSYLRATENARCVNPQGKPAPLWLVREEWNPVQTVQVAVGHHEPTEVERAEARLTPEEVGEDREPAPVAVRREAPVTPTDERNENVELCVYAVEQYDQPVTAAEVAEDTGLHQTTCLKALQLATEHKRLFMRYETTEERRLRWNGRPKGTPSYLFSNKNPVPERTQQVVVGIPLEPLAYEDEYRTEDLIARMRARTKADIPSRWRTLDQWMEYLGEAERERHRLSNMMSRMVNEGHLESRGNRSNRQFRALVPKVTQSPVTIVPEMPGGMDTTEPVEPKPVMDMSVKEYREHQGTLTSPELRERVAELEHKLAEAERENTRLKAAIGALTG
jgi:hypothetical protein